MVLILLLAVPSRCEGGLAYYSDYFSFVGQDASGRVAFALDTNRGRDGDAFQAEHFAVLHDERAGWQPVLGSGPFPYPGGALEVIPDSGHFRFLGDPASGLLIDSPGNGLTLRIEPIPTHLSRRHGSDRYRMGSSAAVLTWKGRTLAGRAIHEFLSREGWNRLTRTYFGYWKAYHGFYLVTVDPATGTWRDFYLHSQRSRKAAALSGLVDGFATGGGRIARLEGAEVTVRESAWALGLFRWPAAWSGSWRDPDDGEEIRFDLRLTQRRSFAHWVLGGFAMGVVKGTVTRGKTTLQAYGLGEILQ